VIFWPFYVVF